MLLRRNCIAALVLCALFSVVSTASEIDPIIKEARERQSKYERDIHDMTIQQAATFESEGMVTKGRIKVKVKGDKYRVETVVENASNPIELLTIHDGKNTWTTNMFTGKMEPAPAGETGKMQENWWDNITANAKVAGTEDVSGSSCYVIDDKDGIRYWLDKKTKDLLQMETKGSGENDVIRAVFSDYRDLDGFGYPYNSESFLNGKRIAKTRVQSVEINTGIADSEFAPAADKTTAQDPKSMPGKEDMNEIMKLLQEQQNKQGGEKNVPQTDYGSMDE